MAGQTSYSLGAASPAFAGQLGDSGPFRVGTYSNGQGSAIPAGILVKLSADNTVTYLGGSTDQVAGVVLNQFARNPNDLTSTNAIQSGDACAVLEEGEVWLLAEEALAVTDKVYVRHTTGTGTQLGAVRNDSDTNTCRRLSGARIILGCSAAGPVLVYFSAAADASNL